MLSAAAVVPLGVAAAAAGVATTTTTAAAAATAVPPTPATTVGVRVAAVRGQGPESRLGGREKARLCHWVPPPDPVTPVFRAGAGEPLPDLRSGSSSGVD